MAPVFFPGIVLSTPQSLLVQDADVMPQDPGFSHGHDTLRQVRHKSWAGLPGPPGRGRSAGSGIGNPWVKKNPHEDHPTNGRCFDPKIEI